MHDEYMYLYSPCLHFKQRVEKLLYIMNQQTYINMIWILVVTANSQDTVPEIGWLLV